MTTASTAEMVAARPVRGLRRPEPSLTQFCQAGPLSGQRRDARAVEHQRHAVRRRLRRVALAPTTPSTHEAAEACSSSGPALRLADGFQFDQFTAHVATLLARRHRHPCRAGMVVHNRRYPRFCGYDRSMTAEAGVPEWPSTRLVEVRWAAEDDRAWRRLGTLTVTATVPPEIATVEVPVPSTVATITAAADSELAALDGWLSSTNGPTLDAVAAHLLRAESLSSSRIEGLDLSARRLAEAEFAPSAATRLAVEVSANVRAMQAATALGVERHPLTVGDRRTAGIGVLPVEFFLLLDFRSRLLPVQLPVRARVTEQLPLVLFAHVRDDEQAIIPDRRRAISRTRQFRFSDDVLRAAPFERKAFLRRCGPLTARPAPARPLVAGVGCRQDDSHG